MLMKKLITTVTLLFLFTSFYAQRTAEDYYNDGMKYAARGNYKEAVEYFDVSIRLKNTDYFVWYNRGITKSLMKDYRAAIADFEETINLKPDYVKAYISIGNCQKLLTNYDSAAMYYSIAIQMDTANSEAYFRRAGMYETMNMRDSAAMDFKKAYELGVPQAEERVKYYNDTAKSRIKLYNISKLTETAADAKYGYTSKNPIKVGTGKDGGPANVRAYLGLLRDARKKPVQYHRIAGCCPHKAAGYTGNVTLEEYEITYTDETGAEKTAKLYLSYYEYDNPKIPVGLKAATKN